MSAVEGYDLEAGELWRHSIAVSNTAGAIAKLKKNITAEDVFTPIKKVLHKSFNPEISSSTTSLQYGQNKWEIEIWNG